MNYSEILRLLLLFVCLILSCCYKFHIFFIFQLVALHGLEADRHLLRCLFSHIDFSAEGSKTSSKDLYQTQLLVQECSALVTKPSFVSNLCYAIDNPLNQQKVSKYSSQNTMILVCNLVTQACIPGRRFSSVRTRIVIGRNNLYAVRSVLLM